MSCVLWRNSSPMRSIATPFYPLRPTMIDWRPQWSATPPFKNMQRCRQAASASGTFCGADSRLSFNASSDRAPLVRSAHHRPGRVAPSDFDSTGPTGAGFLLHLLAVRRLLAAGALIRLIVRLHRMIGSHFTAGHRRLALVSFSSIKSDVTGFVPAHVAARLCLSRVQPLSARAGPAKFFGRHLSASPSNRGKA